MSGDLMLIAIAGAVMSAWYCLAALTERWWGDHGLWSACECPQCVSRRERDR